MTTATKTRTRKDFKDLSPQGQKARLNKYAKEREARGTEEVLARVVKVANIRTIKDDNKIAVFRLAVWDKELKDTKFFTASAFIKKGKDSLEQFYRSVAKGQLVSVEYKENKGYTNIYNMMPRTSKKNASAAVQTEEKELEA